MSLKTLRRPFRYTFNNCAFLLIFINVAVYAFLFFAPNFTRVLALNPRYFIKGRMYWQVITYMFVHQGMSHLLFNMIGLFFFGLSVERSLGSREFLLFYLLSGILSGALSILLYFFVPGYSVFLMGASGAIYALLFAYAVIFPKSRIFIWGILPVPAPLLVVIYTGLALFEQFTNRNMGVAHLTHLAGFIVAALYMRIRMGVHPIKVWIDAYR